MTLLMTPQQHYPAQRIAEYLSRMELPEIRTTVGNVGQVRPTNGLGFSPDFVDCPRCQSRKETQIELVPSEHTR